MVALLGGTGTITWVAHYDSTSATDGLESSGKVTFKTVTSGSC
jgi:hypothetical protein